MNEHDHDEEGQERSVSRRRVIQGIAAGTAAAWAAPAIVNVGSAAYAASAVPPVKCDGCNPNDSCLGQSDCGPAGSGCTCKPAERLGADCICTGNGFCSDFQTCTSTSSCPPGYTCSLSCCGADVLLCLPNCGTPGAAAAAAAKGSGARTDGK